MIPGSLCGKKGVKKAVKGNPCRLCSSVGICLLWISHRRLPLSPLIYTLAAPSALLPIHQLQWEDSPLRVNFMPIYGQRMWRSPPSRPASGPALLPSRGDGVWRCNKWRAALGGETDFNDGASRLNLPVQLTGQMRQNKTGLYWPQTDGIGCDRLLWFLRDKTL